MSVYTPINQQQVKSFLTLYSLGTLIEYSGIQAGIENTNYLIHTSKGKYILTIYESLTASELPYFLQLLEHLCSNNFPAPKLQFCNSRELFTTLQGKPAALFSCLPGTSNHNPSAIQCSVIGEYLAKLHLSTDNCHFNKPNLNNLHGCQSLFDRLQSSLSKTDYQLISSELSFQQSCLIPELPCGIIHADLFKDNVLFEQGTVSGIVDFYDACHDYFLFDIAITCNDWCVDMAEINQEKLTGLLSGYSKYRPLTQDEIDCFPVFLRLAALRFWLSRLEHQLNPRQSELTLAKDPLVFRSLLEYHRAAQ